MYTYLSLVSNTFYHKALCFFLYCLFLAYFMCGCNNIGRLHVIPTETAYVRHEPTPSLTSPFKRNDEPSRSNTMQHLTYQQDDEGNNYFHSAARVGNMAPFKPLLHIGCDAKEIKDVLSIQNKHGETALHSAISNEQYGIAATIIHFAITHNCTNMLYIKNAKGNNTCYLTDTDLCSCLINYIFDNLNTLDAELIHKAIDNPAYAKQLDLAINQNIKERYSQSKPTHNALDNLPTIHTNQSTTRQNRSGLGSTNNGQPHTYDKSFPYRSVLKSHTVTPKEKKPFKCDKCSKTFTQQGSLKIHERIHTGEKPFKCRYCTKAFIQQGRLKIHERIHTGEKPFKCNECSKAFNQKSNLKKHERIHTGEKPFKCRYCTKAFIQQSSLKIHERIHTGEKPFKCRYCTKEFIQQGSLKIHERIHAEKKPCECNGDNRYKSSIHLFKVG